MKLANDDIDRPRTPTKNMDEMKGNQNGLMSATNSSSKRRIISYDRFIPDRTSVDYSVIHHLNSDTFGSPTRKKNINGEYDAVKEEASKVYSQILRNELLGSPLSNAMQLSSPSKILQYRPPNDKRSNSTFRSTSNICIDSPQNEKYSISPITPISQKALLSPRKTPRHISKVPFKVLDAPELADDFYLNLVDWGLSNVLAVGLGTSVYLWSACTSRVTRLCDIGPYDAITSVNWIQRVSCSFLIEGKSISCWNKQRISSALGCIQM
jgi:cell division cycle 20-like protein 1 (cofactor of APC complex)